jgi:hypothetical protein
MVRKKKKLFLIYKLTKQKTLVFPGRTYFFKGKGFWKFDDTHMRIAHEQQRPSATHWMGCKSEQTAVEHLPRRRKEPLTQDPEITSAAAATLSIPTAQHRWKFMATVMMPLAFILVSHF